MHPREAEQVLKAVGCYDQLHPVELKALSLYYRQYSHSKSNSEITEETHRFLVDLIVSQN